jgi:hypothetical protein
MRPDKVACISDRAHAKPYDIGVDRKIWRGPSGGRMKSSTAILLLPACVVAADAFAADKPPQFWNLTTSTVTKLEISRAGANAFQSNQTVNDPDGAVEHDERLKITGVESGAYDLRLTLKDRRTCFARNVHILQGKAFSIEDKDLKDCSNG